MQKKKLAFQPSYFEKKIWAEKKLVCGIDEAGRGALAGPLVTGAAIIPVGKKHKYLKDSKVLNKNQRKEAFIWIQKNCMYSYALCNHHVIDTINIYQATLKTMQKAFMHLMAKYNVAEQTAMVLVDAMPLKLAQPYNTTEVIHFNYGESISPSIAAASIVAKVVRDSIMEQLAYTFPKYQFAKHKGYGTKAHTQALQQFGPSSIHRKTFITKIRKDHEPISTQHRLF